MDWVTLATLLAQYGLPFVEDLISKIESGTKVTAADFAALRALALVKASDVLKAQLAAANIPLTDPHAVALMALVLHAAMAVFSL